MVINFINFNKNRTIMKKLVILTIVALMSVTTFANLVKVPSWDQTLEVKKPLADPSISYIWATASPSTGELQISVILDGTPERDMRANIWIRTYRRIGFSSWQWVWMEYVIYMPVDPYSPNTYGDTFPISTTWQYEGTAGSSNTIMLYDSQINLSYYGPNI
jgi:hypothetical protein